MTENEQPTEDAELLRRRIILVLRMVSIVAALLMAVIRIRPVAWPLILAALVLMVFAGILAVSAAASSGRISADSDTRASASSVSGILFLPLLSTTTVTPQRSRRIHAVTTTVWALWLIGIPPVATLYFVREGALFDAAVALVCIAFVMTGALVIARRTREQAVMMIRLMESRSDKALAKLRRELDFTQNELAEALHARSTYRTRPGQNQTTSFMNLQRELADLKDVNKALTEQLAMVRSEEQRKAEHLDAMEKDIEWLRDELDKRPKVTRKIYKILTIGYTGTGKTALTLKWANPLVDLGTLAGTTMERYERTVSHVGGKDVTVEHVFEIGDWGGERIADALGSTYNEEVHGLLIVVDLASTGPDAPDLTRIDLQLREFQPEVLKWLLTSRLFSFCKSVTLFINKSDLVRGTSSEADALARRLYAPLIDSLNKYRDKVDIRVFVGSALSGYSVHHLFAHLVSRILPKNAYDRQLLQQMQGEVPLEPQRAVQLGNAPDGASRRG